MKFEELNMNPKILKAIKDMGFEEASPIQAQAIPILIDGKDIIGQAQTGTGKTAAFGIPAVERIDQKLKQAQTIILCPTRELAIQVADEIRELCKYLSNIKTLPIYGGQDIVRQIKALKSGVQIIVATPGRMLDHIRRKTIKFDDVHTLILDEADEMLNMGFREDIETILESIPNEHQTVLFSATMPEPIMQLAKKFQNDAEIIKMVKKELTVTNIEQYYFEVRPKNKLEILSRLIDVYESKLSIVFCNTKRQVDELVNELQGRGYFAEGLHGDMKQQQRDRVMSNCRRGSTEVLVATDVAARGIDIDDIDVVFNYDLPQDEEYYVHRIGRTGRAGRKGLSLSFVVGREIYKLKEIEKYCKTKIAPKPIPTLMDVTGRRVEAVTEEIIKIVKTKDIHPMLNEVETLVNNEDITAMELCAGLLYKMVYAQNEEIEEVKSYDKYEKKNKTKDKNRKDMTRLFINVGRKDKIKSGDLLGAIAGEADVAGNKIGAIDIYDNYSFVDVPKDKASHIVKVMNKVKIRGKSIKVEKANNKDKKSA